MPDARTHDAITVITGVETIGGYGDEALAYARAKRPSVEGYRWADDPAFSVFYNAPMLVILSGKADNTLALENCTRSGQVLTIAAHACGLGSCWVGSPNLWLSEPDVRARLPSRNHIAR